MNQSMYHNIELRKLPAGKLYSILEILEDNYTWTSMIKYIPKDPRGEHFEPKYNDEHVRLIVNHARESGRKCTEILFDEWGTSGRTRPTLNTLKDVLVEAEIFRAADMIARMLNEDPPERPPGPGKLIESEILRLLKSLDVEDDSENNSRICKDTTAQMGRNDSLQDICPLDIPKVLDTTAKVGIQNKEESGTSIDMPMFEKIMPSDLLDQFPNHLTGESDQAVQSGTTRNLLDNIPSFSQFGLKSVPLLQSIHQSNTLNSELIHFEYNQLLGMTNCFANRIGSGGFGEVFKGHHLKHGVLAVKKTHKTILNAHREVTMKLFDTEVKMLSQFRHKNIVPILGISKDGPDKCIVCEYIDGGSLEYNLTQKFLGEQQRVNIMLGTAEGLSYLHSVEKPVQKPGTNNTGSEKFIHGDIKSANILLTTSFEPKICDFGLAKELGNTYLQISLVIGTQAYMAPEWYSRTITQKVDIFSFGVVLLEILTGLPSVISANGEDFNIMHYVKDRCRNNISTLLDTPVRKWKKANKIYDLAKNCLDTEWKERPSADKICERLRKMAK